MNLILALVWLVVGVGILAWQYLAPDDPRALRLIIHIGDIPPFSAGWVALLLAAYNVVRWWLRRMYLEQVRTLRAAEEEWRQKWRPRERTERPETPDPNFDFSNQPPAPPNSPEPGQQPPQPGAPFTG